MSNCRALLSVVVVLIAHLVVFSQGGFVTVRGHQFIRNGAPYYFVGTNYWYGSLLGLETDKNRGVRRLRKELDFLKKNGVTNLRLMAGAEGAGLISGITRVGPPLQPEQGKFDESVLDGLDLVLYEMGRRKMTAVVFLSNNWEWSGGFQQYLTWNNLVPEDQITRKLTWDEQRDIVSKFYSCDSCRKAYLKQAELILSRTNKLSGKKYTDDPTVMAWELANEPRPMRPSAVDHYKNWIAETSAFIKTKAPKQLVTLGHEGSIGTESVEIFEEIHRDPNVDYVTIHIWAKNWGWLKGTDVAGGYPVAAEKARKYVEEQLAIAKKLDKPMVIEEFGLPRDGHSFDPASTTIYRDRYFEMMFSFIGDHVAGANFWAFGGTARPTKGQLFWKAGDEYMGDPPMEEQGLNTVFDSDKTTWTIIRSSGLRVRR